MVKLYCINAIESSAHMTFGVQSKQTWNVFIFGRFVVFVLLLLLRECEYEKKQLFICSG